MTTSAPAAPRTYPEHRARALASWHRQWVAARYPGALARNHLRERLGVPDYRPMYDPETYYADTMTPLVDHVVAKAVSSARNKARGGNVNSVPVIAALREVINKSRKV